MIAEPTLEGVTAFDTIQHRGFDVESAYLSATDRFGRPMRIYAARCIPEADQPLPVVLHLPGGSQTVQPEDLAWWAQRGFAACSMDWENGYYANHDPARKSVWPQGVGLKRDPLEREEQAILPLAIRGASAVIDWMADHERADTERLGVAGISWGGYLTWGVAAHDTRVKAIVPVFGCGGLHDADHPGRIRSGEMDDALAELWRQQWDAEGLIDRITVPTLYLSGANDFFGMHLFADRLVDALEARVETRRSSHPNQNHHTGNHHGTTAAAWMDHHLSGGPALPEAPVLHDDLTIEADERRPIVSKRLWWTPSRRPDVFRCWWPGKPANGAARLVFGRVTYADGITLNTRTLKLNGEPVFSAALPAVWPDAVEAGAGMQWGVCTTQFYEAGSADKAPRNEPVDGDATRCRVTIDREGAGAISYVFRGLADPRWNDGSIHKLRITVDGCGQPLTRLQLTLGLDKGGRRELIEQPYPLEGEPTRVGLDLTLDSFNDLPPGTDWIDVRELIISGDVAGPVYEIGPFEKA